MTNRFFYQIYNYFSLNSETPISKFQLNNSRILEINHTGQLSSEMWCQISDSISIFRLSKKVEDDYESLISLRSIKFDILFINIDNNCINSFDYLISIFKNLIFIHNTHELKSNMDKYIILPYINYIPELLNELHNTYSSLIVSLSASIRGLTNYSIYDGDLNEIQRNSNCVEGIILKVKGRD